MVIATYFADSIKSLCLFVKTHREEVGALKVHIEEAESKGVADITKNNKHTLIMVKKKTSESSKSNYEDTQVWAITLNIIRILVKV